MKRDVAGIVASCFVTVLAATEIGKPLVGLRYELYTTYYVLGFVPIFIHRLGHTRIWKQWFKQHVVHHHVRMYPSKRFDSPTPYRNTLDWKVNGNVINFVVPAFIICILMSANLLQFLYISGFVTLMLLREDYIHQQVHLSDSYWKEYSWYKTLKSLHRIHHEGCMDKNFGFVDLFFDLCLGTLAFPSLEKTKKK